MRITAVTPMKNEGPFVLEWLAYHRLIGINDFICFTNDCEDGTDLILERLDEMGLVRHLPNPSTIMGRRWGHHWAVIEYLNQMERLRRSDFFMNFDVDEFVNIKAGKGTFEDLFKATDDADIIAMAQRSFGCAGVSEYDPSKLVIGQFDRTITTHNLAYGRVRPRGIKNIVRGSAPVKRIRNHSPEIAKDAKVRWVNGSGEELPQELFGPRFKTLNGEQAGTDLVQLNHYALRAMENFILKTDRGDANKEAPDELEHWRRYFKKYDDNLETDKTIQRWTKKVEAEVKTLLKDKELAALHEGAVAWHKARFEHLMKDKMRKQLFNQIHGVTARKLEREQRQLEAALAEGAELPKDKAQDAA